MSGLVQDYSKSPIKPSQESAKQASGSISHVGANNGQHAQLPNALDQTFVPAAVNNVPQSPLYSSYSQQQQQVPPRQSIDYGAPPPRRSIDYGAPPTTRDGTSRQSISADQNAPLPNVVGYQMGQKHDSPVMPVPPRDPRYSPADASTQPPQQPTGLYTSGYGQPPSVGQDTLQGYRQNQMHDGGSTDYAENQSSLEIAEQAWQSASKTVGQYAGTAGETVGKVWEGGLKGVKDWLNPESKGMR